MLSLVARLEQTRDNFLYPQVMLLVGKGGLFSSAKVSSGAQVLASEHLNLIISSAVNQHGDRVEKWPVDHIHPIVPRGAPVGSAVLAEQAAHLQKALIASGSRRQILHNLDFHHLGRPRSFHAILQIVRLYHGRAPPTAVRPWRRAYRIV